MDFLPRDKSVIGMIHVAALPGTPRHELAVNDIVNRAVAEAQLLAGCGFDALIIENMHDVPYLNRNVGPEIIAAMTAVGLAVRKVVEVPLGVQILAGANEAALAVAHTIGGQFIRAEGFVFAHVADEGLIEADAGPLLRYRKSIGADDIAIIADIKKKHASHAITADIELADMAHAAQFCGADGIVITGPMTGSATRLSDVAAARKAAPDLPLLVGSGVTAESALQYLEHADAVIVGSAIKEEGVWAKPIDEARAKAFIDAVKSN